MSFGSRTPLLPPFGVRELYDTRTGILQISRSQYESTVESCPDAVLTYVDDDDGEVITVGSGLELQQRLDEPVMAANRRRSRRLQGSTSRRGSVDDSMVHLFDIKHSDKVLDIWRHYEAYSSRNSLHNLSAAAAADDDDDTPSLWQSNSAQADPAPVLAASEPEILVPQPVADSSVHAPTPVENTNETLEQAVGIKAPSNDFLQDLDTVLSAACKGLESLGLADILDNTANAFNSLAQKTRDADTSPVEALLGGFKDVAIEFGKLGLEILDGLEKGAAPAPDSPSSHTEPVSIPSEAVACKCAAKAEARLARKMTRAALKDAKAASREQRREEKKARRLERVAQREARRAMKKGKAREMSSAERGEDSEENYDVKADAHDDDERTALLSSDELTQPVSALESPKRVSFTNLQHNMTSNFTGADAVGEEEPKSEKSPRQNHDPLPSAPVPQVPDLPQIPDIPTHTVHPLPVKMPAEVPSVEAPTSIMDIESSNPDFTARYPPLKSLRRTENVVEMLKKNIDAAPNTLVPGSQAAALNRYPTIGQLEAQRRATGQVGKDQVTSMLADILRRRNQLKSDGPSNNFRPQSDAECGGDWYDTLASPLIPTFPSARVIPTPPKALPGSWPEVRRDQAGAYPVAESSGAFFNRMAGIESSSVTPKQPPSPAVSCRARSPAADQYFSSTSLRRAKTVASLDSAARLTRPFDPLTNAPRLEPQRSLQHEGVPPQRSLSLQQRRHINHPVSTASQDTPLLTLGHYRMAPVVPPPLYGPSVTRRGHPAPPPPPTQPLAPPAPLGVQHALGNGRATVNPPYLAPRPVHHPSPSTSLELHGPESRYWPGQLNKINECVQALTKLGYGIQPNEGVRLKMYASAVDGDLDQAIDLIEEDRKAAEALTSG